MHQVKISDVHKQMLKEICKKYRMKEDEFFEEYIQETYANSFGKRKR